MKWQKARAGYSRQPGFEWGQTPLHMRLPKLKWFKKPIKLQKDITAVNVSVLQNNEKIQDGTTITVGLLIETGICNKGETVKILGHGDIEKKLTIEWVNISQSAQQKIEKAWWSIAS